MLLHFRFYLCNEKLFWGKKEIALKNHNSGYVRLYRVISIGIWNDVLSAGATINRFYLKIMLPWTKKIQFYILRMKEWNKHWFKNNKLLFQLFNQMKGDICLYCVGGGGQVGDLVTFKLSWKFTPPWWTDIITKQIHLSYLVETLQVWDKSPNR